MPTTPSSAVAKKRSSSVSPRSKDVTLEKKCELVHEYWKIKGGKSSFRSLKDAARDICGCNLRTAYSYVKAAQGPGGISNLESKRLGNQNRSKFSPGKAEKIKRAITAGNPPGGAVQSA